TMAVTAYAEGTLHYIGAEKGQAAKVNDILAIVGKEGTDVTPLLKEKRTDKKRVDSAAATAKSDADEKTAVPEKEQDGVVSSADSRVKASPLARKIAKEKGIDLGEVRGTADGGRIVKKD